jgi:hypothetical protein
MVASLTRLEMVLVAVGLTAVAVLALTLLAQRQGRLRHLRTAAGPGWTAAAVGVIAVLVFGSSFAGAKVLRAQARDQREDAFEAADVVPGGSRTATPGPAHAAVVWAVGDGADGHPAAQEVGALVGGQRTDRILYLGDVYGPYAATLEQALGSAVGKVFPTPGNHEWPSQSDAYTQFWTEQGQPGSAYYSFRIAGWQVLSLNSEITHDEHSAQVAWAEQQVAGGGDCRIAYWHRPRYSAGTHGDQRDVDPLWDAVRGKVSLVLGGHDHDMQRMSPQDGTTEMVVGSGGHGHYPLHPHDGLVFGDDQHYGALRLTLTPGHAAYAFVATDGTVLDSGSLSCTEG